MSSLTISSQLSSEARSFLQHLEIYIPVGCLVIDHHSEGLPEPHSQDDWYEVSDTSTVPGNSDNLPQDLHRLIVSGWIRVFTTQMAHIFRIFVLPGDVGHRFVNHSQKSLTKALHTLLRHVDVSPITWQGCPTSQKRVAFDQSAALDEGSLHWMFNTLPSPAPSPDRVKSYFHRKALERLLDGDRQLSGLKTRLYPYQRRSAALMLQRESEARLELDPRLEQRVSPNGSTYFFGPRSTTFLRSPRYYESTKGGVLAETMGLGKTLMCVALILSTRGHLPRIPVQYATMKKRSKVGSLTEMAVSAINRHSAPWRPFFENIAYDTGEHMTQCVELIQKHAPTYEIPIEPFRWNRKTSIPPPETLMLASTSLVCVPRNLFLQWKSELDKHTEKVGGLRMLYMDDPKQALPRPRDLASFDLVLFSRPRFEQEIRDGSDHQGRRKSRYPVSCNCPYIKATRTRDCTCLREEDLYDSPLKHIHFLRMIIDEGHFFTSSKTKAAEVANSIVRADHRWVVTGTPAKDLLGTEMEITADFAAPDEARRQEALQQRRNFSSSEDTGGATRSIGDLVSHFLKVRPFTACDEERSADWRQEIYRQEYHDAKPVIVGFSNCLRRTLESLVIKTRPEDVERDIGLPPLEHHTKRLKPSLYDKLTANTFAFVLTANAVTSERTDTDYLFHPNSRKERNTLVHNLRQSAFAWTGFSREDVEATIANSKGYLEKENVICSEEDRAMLAQCIKQAERMLASSSWSSLSKSHEVGLFVEDWPIASAQFWSFDQTQAFDTSHPLLCGVTQLLKAQAHVNERAASPDPIEGLNGAGVRHLSILQSSAASSTPLVKSGMPSSSVKEQPVHHRLTNHVEKVYPIKSRPSRSRGEQGSAVSDDTHPSTNSHELEGPKVLPANSLLRRTRIIGTTSAKLSYLLSQIAKQHSKEKILIFYDDDNTAYYIAQALEIMHVGHYIYAKSLTAAKKSEYIVQFDRDPRYRVLLMDIGQAAFGLNVPSASRVYFLNPVCQPHIEAQAIKRAHRIGQTKKVVVETLVLEGTIEEQMFERAKRMTRSEHTEAKMLDDDGGIREIIQSVKPIHIGQQEGQALQEMALLENPQQLWSRDSWPQWKTMQDEVHSSKKRTKREAEKPKNAPQKKRKTISDSVTFDDITNPLELETIAGAASVPGTPLQPRHPPQLQGEPAGIMSTQRDQATQIAAAQVQCRAASIFGGEPDDVMPGHQNSQA